MTKCPEYGVDLREGRILDDVLRSIGVSQSPLGKPTSGVVINKHLGNRLNGTAPTDSRVKHYAVYRAARSDPAVAKTIADATFMENIDGLPWTDKQSDTNDVINTRHDYWLVSLDRNYAHYQTVALDAFSMGFA